MSAAPRGYRALLVLYPPRFRAEFGDDLVQAFVDLSRDLGRRRAWTRSLLDLAVIVPRLHMEEVMKPVPIAIVVAALVATGALTVSVGAVAALPLLLLAVIVALAQRTPMAQALVVPPDRRRARLRSAAASSAVFAIAVASWIYHVNTYDSLSTLSVLLHNLVGMLALGATAAYLAAGLLTRTRTP